MKKLLILSLAALLALAALTGCQKPESGLQSANPTKVPLDELGVTFHPVMPGESESPAFGDDNDAQAVDILNRPVFAEQLTVPGGSVSGSYYKVITDYAEFTKLVGDTSGKIETKITEDIFIFDFVVAVFITVPTGGYSFEVEHAENDSHTVKVYVNVTPPAAGIAATQAFETHCMLLGFDAADYYDDLVYDVTVNGKAVTAGSAGAEG